LSKYKQPVDTRPLPTAREERALTVRPPANAEPGPSPHRQRKDARREYQSRKDELTMLYENRLRLLGQDAFIEACRVELRLTHYGDRRLSRNTSCR